MFSVVESARVSQDVITAFNASNSFVKVYSQGGKTIIMRYEVADYGIPYGNISSNLINFAASVEAFYDTIHTGEAKPK